MNKKDEKLLKKEIKRTSRVIEEMARFCKDYYENVEDFEGELTEKEIDKIVDLFSYATENIQNILSKLKYEIKDLED